MRVQPAWRASSSDEEARAFLQRRLSTFSAVLFTALAVVNAVFFVLYGVYDQIAPTHWHAVMIGAGSGLVALVAIWRLVLVRYPLTERVLYRIAPIESCFATATSAKQVAGALRTLGAGGWTPADARAWWAGYHATSAPLLQVPTTLAIDLDRARHVHR